jgi:orotate phosphoribosyltransferase
LASQLVRKLRKQYDGPVDWVIGSDHAGATLSFAVAAQLMAQHDFTEKGEGKTQVWKRLSIQSGEIVLQVEELITTTGTLQAVREGIRAGNPHPVSFAPLSLVLVHRSNIYEFEGTPIVYVEHYDINSWAPEECPLCAGGSERLRPKQNWAKLTGKQ